MYRNSERYADPTAGAAFAHIAYEERKQRRLAAQKQKRADEAVAAAAAHRKKEKVMQSKEIRNRKREAYYSTLTWVKAWPRPIVTNTIGMGGHE